MTGAPTRTVRVLVDVTGIHKTFDYLVPAAAGHVVVGTEVRVRLGARNVRGWIVAVDVEPPVGVTPAPVRAVRGVGPSAEVVELAAWGAWRWAGHPAQLLRAASAPAVVAALGAPAVATPSAGSADPADPVLDAALGGGPVVLRLPPTLDRVPLVTGMIARSLAGGGPGSVLVACPGVRAASRLARHLRFSGFPVADLAADGPDTVRGRAWAQAAAGGSVVVGTRTVAWAPAPDLTLAVVVDEHDEAYQSTRTPTWHARDVLAERCRRAGAPLVLLSPCPSLEALATSRLVTVPPTEERAGWPRLEVLDRRGEDPRTAASLFSEGLGRLLDRSGRTVCVVNRTGRTRLLACRRCGALTRCEHCGAAVHAPADAALICPRCATTRPRVCATCGSAALKNLRIGVSRAREELEALIGEPVAEVTRDGGVVGDLSTTRVVIGTEAVLHRVGTVDTVIFLDVDQELTAPRFRAAEQALALLARGARLVGARSGAGRLVVQTRLPDHPVLVAVTAGDPGVVADSELELREALRFPPFSALAVVSGPGGAEYVGRLDRDVVEVLDGGDERWLVRAPDHDALSRGLAGVPRPEARLRIEVDPLRV